MLPPLSSQGRIRAAELHEQYSVRLMNILKRNNPSVDQADISDAVIDAIMSLASRGVQEDVTKGKLLTLLRKIAQVRVIDRLRKHKRRRQRELKKSAGSVTNQPSASNEADDQVITHELVARYIPELATDDDERKYLQLWLENDSHESIIDKFCTAQKTREQATSLVRQLSDRMRQRLSRLRKQLAQQDQP